MPLRMPSHVHYEIPMAAYIIRNSQICWLQVIVSANAEVGGNPRHPVAALTGQIAPLPPMHK